MRHDGRLECLTNNACHRRFTGLHDFGDCLGNPICFTVTASEQLLYVIQRDAIAGARARA